MSTDSPANRPLPPSDSVDSVGGPRRARLGPGAVKLLLLIPALLLLCGVITARQPYLGTSVDVDVSWMASLPYQWSAGQVSGRDFSHNYGPLGQWLGALAVQGHESRGAISSVGLFSLLLEGLCVALLGLLLAMTERLDGPRALMALAVIALLSIPENAAACRPLILMVAAACAAKALGSRRQPLFAVLAGVCCFLGQLLTGELLIYGFCGVLGFLLVEAGFELLSAIREGAGVPRRQLVTVASTAALFVGTLVLLNALQEIVFLATAGGGYRPLFALRSLVQMVQGYSATMNIDWQLPPANTIGLLLVIGWTGLVILWRRLHSSEPQERLLLAWAVIAVPVLKTSLVRSDDVHIMLGLTPWAVLVVVAHLAWTASTRWALPAFLSLALLVTAWPAADLAEWQTGWTIVAEPTLPFRRLRQLRRRPVPRRKLVPRSLIEWSRTSPSVPMAVVPYQNQIPMALGRPLVAPILQAFAAHSGSQQRAYVAGLERAGDELQILVGLDDLASVRIDQVQTSARLPIIFERLVTGFRARDAFSSDTGYLLLERREAPIAMERIPLAPVESRDGGQRLRQSLQQPARCGLVSLEIEVSYPLLARLLQPAELWVRFELAGERLAASRVLPIEPRGRWESLVFVDPSPTKSAAVFAGVAPVAEWDSAVLESVAGRIGVSPKLLTIRRLSCVSLGALEEVE